MAGAIGKMRSILLATTLAILTAVAMITSLPSVSAEGVASIITEDLFNQILCGNTQDHCGQGCQSQCGGEGSTPTPTPTTPSGQGVASIITEDLFNQLFKHKNDSRCRANGFYTYAAFIAAAKAFPVFGTARDLTTNKRELAAFLGQTSHETTGGWQSAPDGPYAWGLCFKVDILASHAFKTAIWFWMTAQSPKPSCHDVMTGSWSPSASDSASGRAAGYGMVTNIINSGLECGKGSDSRQEDRIGFYKRYCDILGVSYGSNLDYNSQKPL